MSSAELTTVATSTMRPSGLLGLLSRGLELPIQGLLLLALLHIALVSTLDVSVGVNATQLDRPPDEHLQWRLQQSVARYSDMIEADKEWHRRNLLQVETKKQNLRPQEQVSDHGLDKMKSAEQRIREVEQEKKEITKVLHRIKDPEERKQSNQTAVKDKPRQLDPKTSQTKQNPSRKQNREPQKPQTQTQTNVGKMSSESKPQIKEGDIGARHSDPVTKPNNVDNAQQQQRVSRNSTPKKKSRDPTLEELKVREELGNPEPYVLGPKIDDWDEQRAAWFKANPHMKSKPDGKPRVLIVTSSQPWPCKSPEGDFFHVRSLKLKIDYARMHGYEIYYNLAFMDPLFGSYWVKLPIVRKIMLTHPEIEWIFWVDSDAVFTDMLFEPPFEDYDRDGHNMIMWSWKDGYYKQKSWISVNVGVFILRNCQWSLDLLDKWSPMGPQGPVRDAYGKMLTEYMPDRFENYPADDQSALIYLMLTDEAVMDKIRLVENEYIISGWWVEYVNTYERSMELYHPGIGGKRWPWITHFTGCSPCNGGGNEQFGAYEICMNNFTRAYSFADNQVLAYMGYQHENLGSREVVRIRNETTRPIDIVGMNPWKERIAQLSAQA